ncbi:unnamed protein product [Pelagomonas calceolata]|uniref:Histidine kinase n=1 Tax=Pelagomonas calceolata TaxID=35677 RepID=A0A8J2SC47_9STRA|nr:unnamed protein product [Pelagomonas calceolata]
MSWPLPEDEDERMSTLRSLELLDTPRHQEFERITALCGTALNVPICLVSLVDERRQWFLSNRGLGDTRETGREIAFCAHSIMPDATTRVHKEIMVVRDALADDRFKDSALVQGWPHIRFYAGAPLLIGGEDGIKRAIGTLCVIDTAIEHGGTGARTEDGWGVREKQILLDFGALLTGAIEARQQARMAMTVAKTDYISCTAHDIRTPVACFQLSLELLAGSQLTDEQREYVEHAQQSVEVMTETVDRAIETARAQRGARPAQARQESVSVRALLGKIDFLTRSLSKERPELRFSVDDNVPESIETDGTLVWRILMNYVTNALKAAVRPGAEQGRGVDVRISRVRANATGISPAQDCATLLCRAGAIAAAKRGALANEEIATDVVGLAPTARPEEWLKIEVEDSGPGVDAALRHRLFNAFVQAQGTKEGTGLGLFAVKQCASLLSGACGARFKNNERPTKRARTGMLEPKFDQEDSGEGTGSIFWTLVPLQLPNSEPAQKVEEVPETPVEVTRQLETAPIVEQGSRGQALIVEDSAPIRKMLKRILERAGFRVDEAGNGEQGLDMLTRSSYDVCIMDFLMPIMDGVTCTRKYRAWEAAAKRKRTVIVGSSANADETEINSALGGGFFDGFIPKPVTTATLKAKLDELYAAQ